MIDIYKLKRIPLALSIVVILLCFIGCMALWSAASGSIEPWALKQIINVIIFTIVALSIAVTNIKIIYRFAYVFYALGICILFATEFFGIVSMGGQRWLNIASLRIQPAEIMKIALVVTIARYCNNLSIESLNKIKHLCFLALITIVPLVLIMKQPDLGTAALMAFSVIVMLFVAGVYMRYFYICSFLAIVSAPIVWNSLYTYQKQRILVFFNLAQDPLGAGYNIIQSKIAIGSGGFWGKGFNHGTQSHLSFLPEHQTDFIFATIAEEFGFAGVCILILLYSFLIMLFVKISINSKNTFSKLVVIGICAIFFCHVFVNISMQIGLLPVVGIPLPFISYGRTSMASMLIGLGIIMNIYVHKDVKKIS